MTNEEAIKIITGVMNNHHIDSMTNQRIDEALSVAIQALKAEPTKHGRWLWLDGARCSICNHKLQTTGLPSYCPNCWARMDGGENDI